MKPAGAGRGWLTDAPVGTKLAVMLAAFVASVVALVVVMLLALRVSNAVRAYVVGEGHWSRAQKDASFALERYARTGDESDYRAYWEARQVSLGDRAARLELQKPGGGDEAAITRGFVQGRNSAEDVPDLIFLFRNFQGLSYLRDAVGYWTEGDRLMEQQDRLAESLHARRTPLLGDPVELAAVLAEIESSSAELRRLELRFSSTLAEGARWVHRQLLVGIVAITLVLLAAGAWLGLRAAQQLRVGIAALTAGAGRAAAGDLSTPITLASRDEFGHLADAFNDMLRQRKQAADALIARLRFETLVTRLSSAMAALTHERVEDGINHALADLGDHAGVDRAYVFLFSDDGSRVSCVNEWCAPGIAAQIERLQNMEMSEYSWVGTRLQAGEVVHVPSLDELPAEAEAERREWQVESIQSLLLIPMRTGDRIRGFVGFDSVRAEKAWPQESIDLLRIFGEIVLNTLMRVQAEQDLVERNAHLAHAERELRERNERLAQTVRELERSNDELEQFAYAASHDLATPLRGISGFLQLLQRQSADQLDARSREYIDIAMKSATQMHSLIGGLLALSRVGREGPEVALTDCEVVLADVQGQLGGLLAERGVRLTHDPLPKVLAAPVELRQLLQNLVVNAIKFQPGQAPRVHLSAVREKDAWHFSVRDWGIGIKPEHQGRLFQLFHRLHTPDQFEGSGIGLALCKKIVARHGGRIWVESDGRHGSTFHFTLQA